MSQNTETTVYHSPDQTAAPQENLNSSQRLTRKILDQIAHGDLKVGDRLPTELELMKIHGMSRVAVRESIMQLAGIGVISDTRGKRRKIRKLDGSVFGRLFPLMVSLDSGETYRDVFAVRKIVEPHSARLAAENRSEDQVRELQENIEKYGACLEGEGPEIERQKAAVQVDGEFHMIIAHASGNVLLSIILESLSLYLLEVQLQACRGNLEINHRAHEAHQRIARAIIDQSPDRASVEMAYHLQYSDDLLSKTKEPEAPVEA